MLVAADPAQDKLMVIAPIKGGPAERAGVLPGDEVRGCLHMCTALAHLIPETSPVTTGADEPIRSLNKRPKLGLLHSTCKDIPFILL